MTVRQIRVFGDPVLRTSCNPVRIGGTGVAELITDLIDTVKLPGRAGVAAPQIGASHRAFSYNVDGEVGYVINPELVELSGEPELIDEGCLSVPGFYFLRRRYPFARVIGVNLDGSAIELQGSGLLAQVLQHEVDHLDGKLFIEGLDRDDKREAMRQIRESAWF